MTTYSFPGRSGASRTSRAVKRALARLFSISSRLRNRSVEPEETTWSSRTKRYDCRNETWQDDLGPSRSLLDLSDARDVLDDRAGVDSPVLPCSPLRAPRLE